MLADRITEDADWKDGINVFRQTICQKLKELEQKIEQLEKEKINGSI